MISANKARSTRQWAAACAAALLSACGGGVVSDPGGTSPDVRLQCGAGSCVPSSTLSTGSITALMYVVDDGTRTQAQAGFNTDGSIFHNVELEGDTLWFSDGSTQTRMALAREGAWDFFQDLLTLGQPISPTSRPSRRPRAPTSSSCAAPAAPSPAR